MPSPDEEDDDVVVHTRQSDSQPSDPVEVSEQVLSLFGPSVHVQAPLMHMLLREQDWDDDDEPLDVEELVPLEPLELELAVLSSLLQPVERSTAAAARGRRTTRTMAIMGEPPGNEARPYHARRPCCADGWIASFAASAPQRTSNGGFSNEPARHVVCSARGMKLSASLAAFALTATVLAGCAGPPSEEDTSGEGSSAMFGLFDPPFEDGLYVGEGDGERLSLDLRETAVTITLHYRDTGNTVSLCEAEISRIVGTPRDGAWPFRGRACRGDIRRASGDGVYLSWELLGGVRGSRTFAPKR